MTTIAYDGKTIAADTQLTFDSVKVYCRKIFRLEQRGWIWCGSGDAAVEAAVLDYLKNGGPKPEKKELKRFEAIIYNYKEHTIWFMNNSLALLPLVDRFFSIGSGWQIARASMLLGLPAKAAVEMASEIDIYTNNLVDTYDIELDQIKQVTLPCHN